MNKPNGVIIDRKYEASFRRLSSENLASLILGLLEYANTGDCQSEIGEAALPLFELMKLDLQRDFEAYEEKCRINSENGKRGGRPKKQPFSEKTDRFFEEAEKGNNNSNNNSNSNNKGNSNNNSKYNNNYNDKEEEASEECNDNANAKEALEASTDPAPQGSVPPPPPPPENIWEELRALSVPLSYAEDRLERAEYFASVERKRVSEVIYEWWQKDRCGTPPNKSASPPSSSLPKTYDVDDFFQAALQRSWEEMV